MEKGEGKEISILHTDQTHKAVAKENTGEYISDRWETKCNRSDLENKIN